MSWHAYLVCVSCGQEIHEANYTSNTNAMIRAAGGNDWPRDFHGLTGPEGAAYLDRVVSELRSDPRRYDAMNPPNKWGKRSTLVTVLSAMRDAVPEPPARWEVEW